MAAVARKIINVLAPKTLRAVVSIAAASDFGPAMLADEILGLTDEVLSVHRYIIKNMGASMLTPSKVQYCVSELPGDISDQMKGIVGRDPLAYVSAAGAYSS